jgi:hypothetical protein
MTVDDFLRQAWPDCSTCGGTGIIPGAVFGDPDIAWWKNPDRVCHCVPVLIIRAPDA